MAIAKDGVELDQRIAIIGMSGRFPGAENLEQFWQNIKAGKETIVFYKEEELVAAGRSLGHIRIPGYVRASGELAGIEYFDAAFFGYTPREAELMDPQQRLLLECAWEALEDAGYVANRFTGSIGIYAGAGQNHYLLQNIYASQHALAYLDDMLVMIGNDKDYLPTRVSYKLDLSGPSVGIQTACSTALVATHLACQSLLHYECDMALAGAVSLQVPQKSGYIYREGSSLSPDGHCRAFDANARGSAIGSGLGVIVLRRLPDALEAGDHIYAVILGSAVNNDASQRVSYTAPSVQGQTRVIQDALGMAEVDPATLGYVEAQGTGTSMGDLVEFTALAQVFGASTDRRGFCALGTVKTNIGHLNAASGMAGLIKTVLALWHRQIPASLHFETANPQIDFASSPFYINTRLAEWPARATPRRAGVSSFGIGGTNAHIILEEALTTPREEQRSRSRRKYQLIPLAARSQSALQKMRANVAVYLRRQPDIQLIDAAYTLLVGRQAFNQRDFIVASTIAEVIDVLETCVSPAESDKKKNITPSLSLVLPEENIASAQAAYALYSEEPLFAGLYEGYKGLFQTYVNLPLPASLEQYNQLPDWGRSAAYFLLEYALAKTWRELQVQPKSLVAWGIGEYVAACLGEVFSLETALMLVVRRAQLLSRFSQEGSIAQEMFGSDPARLQLHLSALSFYAANRGNWIEPRQLATLEYWEAEVRAAFTRRQPTFQILSRTQNIFLVLAVPGTDTDLQEQMDSPVLFALVGKGKEASRHFLTTLGKIWQNGATIDWSALLEPDLPRRISLPTYPFERERYWIDPPGVSPVQHPSVPASAAGEAPSQAALHPRPALPEEYQAPGNELERELVELWQDVLGFEGIGVNDNIFDLGADSLLLQQLATQAQQVGLAVELPMLYNNQTIAELAAVLEST